MATRAALPTVPRQREYIASNGNILNDDSKKAILRLVMMEVGLTAPDSEPPRPVVLENSTTREVSINLDNVDNVDVVLQIYNIVLARRASLNEPASLTHAQKR